MLTRSSTVRAYEVWGLGWEPGDTPMFIVAFSDKGKARSRIQKLRRSHPHARYEIRVTKRATRVSLFDTSSRTKKKRAR